MRMTTIEIKRDRGVALAWRKLGGFVVAPCDANTINITLKPPHVYPETTTAAYIDTFFRTVQ
jgi:hypothetical protein